MLATDLEYTEKWRSVLGDKSQVLFLEGPSQTSKTTLSGVKLVKEALNSPKGQTLFFLSGESTNTLYRNFIEPETGVTKLFPTVVKYVGGGSAGGQRLEVNAYYDGYLEVKKIFFVGYKNKDSETKILGSKPYLVFADEFNKAHDQFVKAIMTRVASVGTKLIATSNGDSPDKLFYQYLNACRPIAKYAQDVPISTQEQLNDSEPREGWTYYFFGLDDRPLVTKEWIQRMYTMHPEGSFEFNSKVLGIRQPTEGILYGHLLNKMHDVNLEDINMSAIIEVLCGVDIGSGAEGSNRARTVFVLSAYSRQYQRMIVLDGMLSNEIGHKETIKELNGFLKYWYVDFQHKMKGVYIDSAEPAFIATTKKDIFTHLIDVKPSVKKNALVDSKTRVSLKEQMIHKHRMLFANTKGAQMVKQQLAKVKGLNGVTIDEDLLHNDINDGLDYSMTPRYAKLMKAPV